MMPNLMEIFDNQRRYVVFLRYYLRGLNLLLDCTIPLTTIGFNFNRELLRHRFFFLQGSNRFGKCTLLCFLNDLFLAKA